MSTKITTYEQGVEELLYLARDADLFGETGRSVELENAAGVLTEWLAAGQPDPCPIDLSTYNIELVQESPTDIDQKQTDYEAKIDAQRPPLSYVTVESEEEEVDSKKQIVPPLEKDISDIHADQVKPPSEGAHGEGSSGGGSIGYRDHEPVESIPASADGGEQPSKTDRITESKIDKDLEIGPLPIKMESPEHIELRRQITAARHHLETGELREAVALSRNVVEHAGDITDVHETARDLYDQAQRRLNNKLTKALTEGDRARREGKEEESRKYYKEALDLDPENEHAQQALLELDHAIATSLTENEYIKLKTGLKERHNIEVLGKAVYLAEALDKEDKLPAVLVEILRAAREAYNAQRIAHGEETTMMRFGDLDARKSARDVFERHVAIGDEIIFDVTINKNRPAVDVLQEADKLYEERSADTAQYVLSLVNLLLPGHPRAAAERIKESLKQPFFPQHKDILDEKMIEVEQLLRGQEVAESLLERARQESDALKIMNLVAQAKAAFIDLPGIQERLDAARRTALETLVAGITHHHSQAEAYVKAAVFFSGKEKNKFFKQARLEVTAGDKLQAQWPEQEKPKELLDLIESAKRIVVFIEEQEALTSEFEGQVETILEKITDDGTREAGLIMFAKLRSDPRFEAFPDLHALNEMMDQYRDVRSRLEEAELACQAHDWQRTYKLAKDIYDSGKAGQWLEKVEALRREAEIELSIQEAQLALEKDQFQDANRILSKLINTVDKTLAASLEKRLKFELDKIDHAIADNPPMQELFDQAMTIRDSGKTGIRLQALHLFRYIAGDPTEPREEGWPDYRLSLRTADARREARVLGETLSREWLPMLEEAYKERTIKSPADDDLLILAERAKWLRETNLIESEEQRKVIRWAEMNAEFQRVAKLENSGAWDDVISILTELNINYPRQPELEVRLHNARVQQLVARIHTMISSGQVDQAIELITNGDIDENIRNTVEIMVILADAQANQGDFTRSFNTLDQIGRRFAHAKKAIAQKEAELRARQAWLINKPESWDIERPDQDKPEWSINGPAEALEILYQALEDGEYEDTEVLQELLQDYFIRAKEYLIDQASRKQNEATRTGKVDAVIALLDLRRLEDIVGLAEAKRESTRRVKPLRDSFAEVGRSLIDRVTEFGDQLSLPLTDTLVETEQLHSRMRALLLATTNFNINLGQEIIDRIHQNVGSVENMRENLLRAKKSLAQVSNDDIWDNALRKGDFYDLRQIDKRLRNMNIEFISEVKYFYNKLKEWEEIHDALAERIIKISKLFTDGDFEQTIEVLDETKIFPQRRSDGRDWNTIVAREIQASEKTSGQVDQTGYQHIRQVMEVRLTIQDIYGDQELVGWDVVESAAHYRLLESEAWALWNRDCSVLMNKLVNAGNLTQSYELDAPLGPRLYDFEMLRNLAEEAVQVLRTGPVLESGVKAKISSKQAKALYQEGKRRLQSAQETLDYANKKVTVIQTQINEIGGFPTPENFKDATAQNDWQRLKKLIEQAERIGSNNSQDKKRVETYIRIYEEHAFQNQSQNGDGFISKIRDAFRNR